MTILSLADDSLELTIEVADDGAARIVRIASGTVAVGPSTRPLIEVMTVGTGTGTAGRMDDTAIGRDLRYRGHRRDVGEFGPRLTVDLLDPATGVAADVALEIVAGSGTVRSVITITNAGTRDVELLAVSSLVLGSADWSRDASRIHLADSDWLAENRWRSGTLIELGEPAITAAVHASHVPRGRLAVRGRGSWSTGEHLPIGALEQPDGSTVLWQIENGGAWRWEVAEALEGLVVVAAGPSDRDANWSSVLAPGEAFTAVPATLTLASGGIDGAFARLTAYRRRTRRPSPSGSALPVVFNDYMNTLMADPTTEKLLPLVRAAGEVGAEVFCVDAGWYSEEPGWWDSVGAWMPSSTRFPNGFGEVVDAIRAAGMTPGLWLEPEVVGIRSEVVRQLPLEAFLLRHGERVVVDGRHLLDLRHPAATAHLDRVVDRLVAELGIGFFKFDYNVSSDIGTDHDATGPGDGQLRVARAHLAWIESLLDRHPGLLVEACASGGMRGDWATISRFEMMSTSDQQDALATVPIAAAAPTIVLPEQAGVWCYPQPGITDAEWSVALAGGMLTRPYLSGHLDRMTSEERGRIAEFLGTYRGIRASIPTGVPFWPLGLPAWDDAWVATALRVDPGDTLLTLWRRGGGATAAELDLGHAPASIEPLLRPVEGARWERIGDRLVVVLPVDSAISLRVRG